jgi:hypothetical protein
MFRELQKNNRFLSKIAIAFSCHSPVDSRTASDDEFTSLLEKGKKHSM